MYVLLLYNLTFFKIFFLGSNVTALHARNFTMHSLDVSLFNLTKLKLGQLAITDGHITELRGTLDMVNLTCLNLSGNSLINMSENMFSSLNVIENLDLSGNDLKEIVHINTTAEVFKLDISGN